MTTYIELKGIRKTYHPARKVSVEALRSVDLEIKKGEMIAITGVSGSGKSTLLHILGFLEHYSEGSMFFETAISHKLSATEMAKMRNQKIGFIMQDFALIPYRSAYENIELPLIFAKVPRKDRRNRIRVLSEKLGIKDLLRRKVNQMSGGQKQRVAIARALINDPELILADEPTGNLDRKTKHDVMALIKSIHEEGKTIVIVTHDPEVAELADRQLHIDDGTIEYGVCKL